MKKITISIVVSLLCLNLGANAQARSNATALKIGDQVPDIAITNIINYPSKTAKISDFKGKLLILDFWATWCAPCIAMIPKMDSLQKKFNAQVQFLPVAYQSQAEIQTFMTKLQKQHNKTYNLPDVVEDKTLIQLFPHTSLPHYVWINQDGKVVAITEYDQVNDQNIVKFLNGNLSKLHVKRDEAQQPYNNHLPLFINNNGTVKSPLTYHSVLTGYVEGLPGGSTQYPLDSLNGLKITLRNVPLLWLFRSAYGEGKMYFGKNRIQLSVKDTTHINSSLKGSAYLDWLKQGNGFCYEVVVSRAYSPVAYKIMQRDMSLFFDQYKVTIQKVTKKCLLLVRTSTNDSLRSAGGQPEAAFNLTGFKLQNATLINLITQLNVIYLQNSPYPVIDDTGYSGPVDLNIQANLSDVNSMNKELSRYGLAFKYGDRKIDMLVISDSVQPTNQVKPY